jgi:mannan endo-1,4-beta-mannosidase
VNLIAIPPSNPAATPGAKKLLEFMYNISGKKILAGQESMFFDGTFPSCRDQYVFQRTGKYPAVYATDFGDVNTGNLSDRHKVVSNCIAYAKAGSIISIQYHMIQPDLEDGAGFAAMNIKGSTYTKIDEILTPGSKLNTIFNTRLDELSGYLKTLEDNNIPVIFRPFHEMNGDWFWWSYQPRYKDLWIYTWKYFAENKKCNNLLWMFSVNYWSEAAEMTDPNYYYPGDQYVDMLGMDVYTNYGHNYSKSSHDALRELGNGRPIAITENGSFPSDFGSWRVEQPYWVYFMTWWGFEGDEKGNTQVLYDEVYGHSSVITQGELNLRFAL